MTNPDWADEVVSVLVSDGLPCCDVCQCENGKKLHCACHRKQLATALRKAKAEGRAAGLREAAGMAENFPAYAHGSLATAPPQAAEQAADEIASALRTRADEVEKGLDAAPPI